MNEPSARALDHKTYAVSCKVTDESSLNVAEELLVLALEKLRGEGE